MTKITYASLKLKTLEDVKELDFEDKKIEVKQYLPIEDKLDLIDITLQKSKERDIYNPTKINMFFHLHLVYLYTNITFTDKQREDEYKLFDSLNCNGLIDKIVELIPEDEYCDLLNDIEERIDTELEYSTTLAGLISKVINDLPAQVEGLTDILKDFDFSKYQNVMDFVKAANGGNEI